MKNATYLFVTMMLMSVAGFSQSYIDYSVPNENAIGFGPSLLILSDNTLEDSPFPGVQFNLDAAMGQHFVVGLRADAFKKTVEIKNEIVPSFEQQKRLYSLGGQVSLDPGETGKGLYIGTNLSYLWTDFRLEDVETGEFSVMDRNQNSSHMLGGVHIGFNGNFSDRMSLGIQTDLGVAIGKSDTQAMSKAHIGLKYRF